MEQLAARWAHNPKVTGSSPVPATRKPSEKSEGFFFSHSPDKHRPYAASIFDPYIHTLFATTHQLTRPHLLCSYEKQAQPFRYSQKIFRYSRISFTYSRLRCTHSQLYFTYSRLRCTYSELYFTYSRLHCSYSQLIFTCSLLRCALLLCFL